LLAAGASLLMLTGCGPPGPEAADVPGSGLTVLAQGASGYAQARPGQALAFPRDHGPHPDFRIEWWYLTANLEDADGRPYGAQWTLFRFAARPPENTSADAANPWQNEQVFMAHMGISTPKEHVAFQRYARGGDHDGVRQAGVRAEPFAAWLDDWRLESTGASWLPLEVFARQERYAVHLRLDSERPLVLQGEGGFSQKNPAGTGSYYYSHPFLQASGTLVLEDENVQVSGQAWLDREWSSQFLQADQSGWDWFALHLDSGEKLMLFQLRSKQGGPPFRHAALFDPDGSKRTLDPSRLRFDVLEQRPVAGRALPLRWRIDLPELSRTLEIEALHDEQWMDVDFPYWEGIVMVRGEGEARGGQGYMELTGY
jgi:predicted secreted hydrolase